MSRAEIEAEFKRRFIIASLETGMDVIGVDGNTVLLAKTDGRTVYHIKLLVDVSVYSNV